MIWVTDETHSLYDVRQKITVDGRLLWIRGHDVVRVTFIPEDA